MYGLLALPQLNLCTRNTLLCVRVVPYSNLICLVSCTVVLHSCERSMTVTVSVHCHL